MKAKLFTADMALRVTDLALQVHGGAGYTKELVIERLYRDARGLTLHFGVTEPLKELVGKSLMGLMPG
jgi:acyl-CoA dehydrogenase